MASMAELKEHAEMLAENVKVSFQILGMEEERRDGPKTVGAIMTVMEHEFPHTPRETIEAVVQQITACDDATLLEMEDPDPDEYLP